MAARGVMDGPDGLTLILIAGFAALVLYGMFWVAREMARREERAARWKGNGNAENAYRKTQAEAEVEAEAREEHNREEHNREKDKKEKHQGE